MRQALVRTRAILALRLEALLLGGVGIVHAFLVVA